MKFNLGCGLDYRQGWTNVDRSAAVGADLVHDLLSFPWPIADGAADEVLLAEVVDELSMSWPAFLRVWQELYRICRPEAVVTVRLADSASSANPFRTAITPKFFEALDLAKTEAGVAGDQAATPFAQQLGVDFAVASITQFLADPWAARLNDGELKEPMLSEAVRSYNNVVKSAEVRMTVRKPFRFGRHLAQAPALVVRRIGGLGDVLMALSAFRAVKHFIDIPIFLETAPEFADFARLCPFVDAVHSDHAALVADLATRGLTEAKLIDWSPVRYGISSRHEVDAFLQSLGLTPPDDTKGLVIDLPDSPDLAAVDARLATLGPHRRKIVLHPGLSDPNRTWPAAFWQAVAAHALDAGHAVLTIGRNHGADGKGAVSLGRPGVLDFSDTLDLAGSLHLMRRCDLLVSGDAGPIQIAGASDIAIVGLYSTVAARNRLPYRNGSTRYKAVGLAPECAFHPCYEGLKDGATVARFRDVEGLAPDNINRLFALWCLRDDRYACTRETRTLDLVKEQISALA